MLNYIFEHNSIISCIITKSSDPTGEFCSLFKVLSSPRSLSIICHTNTFLWQPFNGNSYLLDEKEPGEDDLLMSLVKRTISSNCDIIYFFSAHFLKYLFWVTVNKQSELLLLFPLATVTFLLSLQTTGLRK